MEIAELVHKIDELSRPLLGEDAALISGDLLEHGEFALVIEFVCDQFIDTDVAIPETLAKDIRAAVDAMALDPDRTWDFLTVSKGNPPRNVILGTKDFNKLFNETTSIYQEVASGFSDVDSAWVEEFLENYEFELALDVICGVLIRKKTPITRQLLRKIKELLVDTGRSSDTWVGFVIKDE